MKTLNSCLVAELKDILKIMGKLNSMSIELQFQGEDLLRYRHLLSKCIALTAKEANLAEESLYPHPVSYYKSLAKCNNSLTFPYINLYDLKTLTTTLTDRISHVNLAYENKLKLIQYFVLQLDSI